MREILPTTLFIGIQCDDVEKPQEGRIVYGQYSRNGSITKFITKKEEAEFLSNQLMIMIELIKQQKEKMGIE